MTSIPKFGLFGLDMSIHDATHKLETLLVVNMPKTSRNKHISDFIRMAMALQVTARPSCPFKFREFLSRLESKKSFSHICQALLVYVECFRLDEEQILFAADSMDNKFCLVFVEKAVAKPKFVSPYFKEAVKPKAKLDDHIMDAFWGGFSVAKEPSVPSKANFVDGLLDSIF